MFSQKECEEKKLAKYFLRFFRFLGNLVLHLKQNTLGSYPKDNDDPKDIDDQNSKMKKEECKVEQISEYDSCLEIYWTINYAQ